MCIAEQRISSAHSLLRSGVATSLTVKYPMGEKGGTVWKYSILLFNARQTCMIWDGWHLFLKGLSLQDSFDGSIQPNTVCIILLILLGSWWQWPCWTVDDSEAETDISTVFTVKDPLKLLRKYCACVFSLLSPPLVIWLVWVPVFELNSRLSG